MCVYFFSNFFFNFTASDGLYYTLYKATYTTVLNNNLCILDTNLVATVKLVSSFLMERFFRWALFDVTNT